MTLPLSEFARFASTAIRDWTAFEANQTIRARDIEVAARVRTFGGDALSVTYVTYKSPFADMDDLLGGQAEFVREDLEKATLTYDGRSTLYVSPSASFALRSPGRRLYEPLPEFNALGEIRCLDDMARDYLLRDAGEGTHDGRATRSIGLKPKRSHAASLFRLASFPIERAEVAFDAETFFPLRVSFLPSRDTALASIPAEDPWVAIEYAGVRRLREGETVTPVEPPAEARCFEERLVPVDELPSLVPCPCAPFVPALRALALEPADGMARVTLDASSARGYVALPLVQIDPRGRPEGSAFLWFGNYVSRLMARRRRLAGERGETMPVGEVSVRILHRKSLWGEAPDVTHLPDIEDAVWERGGTFFVLTAEGVPRERIAELVATLV